MEIFLELFYFSLRQDQDMSFMAIYIPEMTIDHRPAAKISMILQGVCYFLRVEIEPGPEDLQRIFNDSWCKEGNVRDLNLAVYSG
jgi:hypothetical protein